jgi:segregation and condensation protein B
MRLTQIIEALLFASDAPLSAADLARVDERLDEDTVQAVIDELRSEYDAAERSFQIVDVAGGYQLLTRPEFVSVLERYETVPQPSRLSTPALEVLAIIAYRQPLGRTEIEEIRGVSSSGVLKTLLDRHLVDVVGRAEGLGRPLLYGTTQKFLEHFGFRSLEDMPRPDELPVVLRARSFAGIESPGTEPIPEGEPGHVEAPAPVSEEELDREAERIIESAAEPEHPDPLVMAAAADQEHALGLEAAAPPARLLEEFEAPVALDAEPLVTELEGDEVTPGVAGAGAEEDRPPA